MNNVTSNPFTSLSIRQETKNRLKEYRDETHCTSYDEAINILFDSFDAALKEMEKLTNEQ